MPETIMTSTSKLEIEKTLVVSVQHITERDVDLMRIWADGRLSPLVTDSSIYWVSARIDRDEPPDLSVMSTEFRELYGWAARHPENFSAIKFDGDGPVLEEFPTQEW